MPARTRGAGRAPRRKRRAAASGGCCDGNCVRPSRFSSGYSGIMPRGWPVDIPHGLCEFPRMITLTTLQLLLLCAGAAVGGAIFGVIGFAYGVLISIFIHH